MKRNYIAIIALILTPLIIIQWNLKFVWLRLNAGMEIFANVYIISFGYILAYLLIYKNHKVGYVMMWVVNIALLSMQLLFLNNDMANLIKSVDLWLNVILSIDYIKNGILK